MLFSILQGDSIQSIIISLLLTVPVVIFALCVHETAHGYIAYKCGDSTAYNLGRLTLNPARHLDLFGTLAMIVFGFGWAKPVPINTRNFKNPKRDMALSAAAGPAANLIMGLISAVLFGFTAAWNAYAEITSPTGIWFTVSFWVMQFMWASALLNFVFAFFNLIPVPPFDGSRIALAFLPTKAYFGIMRHEREIMFGILILMLVLSQFGISPFSWLAEWIIYKIANPVYGLGIDLFISLL
ncbi:MAG: site-2 protease family protein [Clostridia bacterium]|nr:site-2 protease family protein [Clostridia bacterium]